MVRLRLVATLFIALSAALVPVRPAAAQMQMHHHHAAPADSTHRVAKPGPPAHRPTHGRRMPSKRHAAQHHEMQMPEHHHDMAEMGHDHAMAMTGMYGPYAM